MTARGLRVAVLGPLEVTRDGSPCKVGGAKPRLVVALLALHPGRVVSTETLVDALWPGNAPDKAVATLQVHVSAVRRALDVDEGAATSSVVNRGSGYLLDVEPDAVDAVEFEELVRRGRASFEAGDYREASTELRAADTKWRGAAFADLAGEAALAGPAAALEEARLAAVELRIAADLALGAHADVAAELRALVAEHPLREDLWAQLMLALYRSGRQADALRAYQEVRTHLLDELGIDPGPTLQQLEAAVLAQDNALDWKPPERTDEHSSSEGNAILVTTIVGARHTAPPAVLVDAGGTRHRVQHNFTIGRHPSSDVRVDDGLASRRHAVVRASGDAHVVIDLGSTNGTRVNDDAVDEATLSDGDVITIGETNLRYELDR